MEPSPTKKDGDNVRVLEDAAASVRALRKDADAQWVAGLRPEDEEEEILRAALLRKMHSSRGATSTGGALDGAAVAPRGWWLLLPVAVGCLWICLLLARFFSLTHYSSSMLLQIEFPAYEFREWELLRLAIASEPESSASWNLLSKVVLPSVGTTTLASLFAVLLNYKVGKATQDFLCFCGFGVGALSLMSGLSSVAIILAGCTSADPAIECFTPIVTTWISSMMRWVLPWVALWPVATMWDHLAARRLRQQSLWVVRSIQWRLVCAVPILGYAAVVALTHWVCYRTDTTLCGDPSPVSWGTLLEGDASVVRHSGLLLFFLEGTEAISCMAAIVFLAKCAMQKQLCLVPIEQAPQYAALTPPSQMEGQRGKSKAE